MSPARLGLAWAVEVVVLAVALLEVRVKLKMDSLKSRPLSSNSSSSERHEKRTISNRRPLLLLPLNNSNLASSRALTSK